MEMTVATERRSGKKGGRRAIIIFAVTLVGLTFFSNTLLNMSLPQVRWVQPQQGLLSHEVRGSGVVEAAETHSLYTETAWPVDQAMVEAGDRVKKGDELVTFQTRDAENLLKDQEARYRQKQLSLEALQDRYPEAARIEDEEAKRSLSREIESAKLDLQIQMRQIDDLRRQLNEFAVLKSPVDGVITKLDAVKGAPIAGGIAAVTVADLSKGLTFKASIEADMAGYIQAGDHTEVFFPALENARIQAEIIEVRDVPSAPAGADAAENREELKEVTLSLQDERLQGGERGEFAISKKSSSPAALLPAGAVREDENGSYVLVLQEKKGTLGTEYYLQKAYVEAGDADEESVAIASGVTLLDKVVVSSNKPVADGDRVLQMNG
ncbi:efflux RND transporter periplasmic adaptor subunit [Paenibacillus nasutitermitis]|uniref:RND transporter n=1 Tax=Paenibacillus nasutitermitis TaxID=1652958 RepID=A0A916YLX3_9BACL|nr:efflux RND transporter periplasmic adaptor subunit [Paenibacillus nasutitermitis]GGD50707.1 RND transporter [Paenibacillus nasutitermitis]